MQLRKALDEVPVGLRVIISGTPIQVGLNGWMWEQLGGAVAGHSGSWPMDAGLCGLCVLKLGCHAARHNTD